MISKVSPISVFEVSSDFLKYNVVQVYFSAGKFGPKL